MGKLPLPTSIYFHMKLILQALCLSLLPLRILAADSIILSPTADWVKPDEIADNVKAECDLPRFQIEEIKKYLTERSLPCSIAAKDEVPATGTYLQVRIIEAVSGGNAFIGHHKHVTISAKLFVNGVEVAKATKARDSMGGFAGNYKGSCTVLHRCCETLGKDVAEWVKEQQTLKK